MPFSILKLKFYSRFLGRINLPDNVTTLFLFNVYQNLMLLLSTLAKAVLVIDVAG